MKNLWVKVVVPIVSVLFILSGCANNDGAMDLGNGTQDNGNQQENGQGGQNQDGENGQGQNGGNEEGASVQSTEPGDDTSQGHHEEHQQGASVYDSKVGERDMNDGRIIPSAHGEKTQSTDEHGGTTHGMGSNVYSLIGSSGLHDGGISSHLESRLSGEGIDGVEVFVLDDTVILANSASEPTANQYDPVQSHVLSGSDGMSGRGEPEEVTAKEAKDDNLEKAQDYMNRVFNNNVQILTATNPKAVELIDKIKKDLKSDKVPYSQVSKDIISLIKMTEQK